VESTFKIRASAYRMGESPVETCIRLLETEHCDYICEATAIADLLLQDISSEVDIVQEDIDTIRGMNQKITGVFKQILAVLSDSGIESEITLNFPLIVKGGGDKERALATLQRLLEEEKVSPIRRAAERARIRAPPKRLSYATRRQGRDEFTGVTRKR
jgi:hypothetical protein